MFNFDRPMSGSDFMAELERFIEFWLGPHDASYGEPENALYGMQLPEPLARLYRFAGRWPTVSRDYAGARNALCIQDALRSPEHLEALPDGKLIFLDENQGVWRCATAMEGKNPPVWVSGEARDRSDEEWIRLECSLVHFLGGFVMQELVLGSRVCSTNDVLTKALTPLVENATPFWSGAEYVFGGEKRCFLLLDEGILVGRLHDRLWFAANSNSGMAAIERRMGGICRVSLRIPSGWSLDINTDGSGKIYHFGSMMTTGKFPPTTFVFETVRDLLITQSEERKFPHREFFVFPFRAGDRYAPGRGLRDLRVVTDLMSRAIRAVNEKEVMYETAIRNLELPGT
jgi:hypothetical protein